MPATKFTMLFGLHTTDAAGNPARVAGWSESFISTQLSPSTQLFGNAINLARVRAALLPQNTSIVGTRFQRVDPVGATKAYDDTYAPGQNVGNDLPSLALQWTIRSPDSNNTRSLILRGIPDSRVQLGEYVPTSGFAAALVTFFAELRANWKMRSIDKTIRPFKITKIEESVMTCPIDHGLAIGNVINVMSTRVELFDRKTSYQAEIAAVPTTKTALLYLPGRQTVIPDSVGGRFRKVAIIYPGISIDADEVLTPVAISRKAGRPFRQFHGRRSTNRL